MTDLSKGMKKTFNCTWKSEHLYLDILYLSIVDKRGFEILEYRGRFLGDIPILIIDQSPKDISLEVKILILLQLLITQGYRQPGICLC